MAGRLAGWPAGRPAAAARFSSQLHANLLGHAGRANKWLCGRLLTSRRRSGATIRVRLAAENQNRIKLANSNVSRRPAFAPIHFPHNIVRRFLSIHHRSARLGGATSSLPASQQKRQQIMMNDHIPATLSSSGLANRKSGRAKRFIIRHLRSTWLGRPFISRQSKQAPGRLLSPAGRNCNRYPRSVGRGTKAEAHLSAPALSFAVRAGTKASHAKATVMMTKRALCRAGTGPSGFRLARPACWETKPPRRPRTMEIQAGRALLSGGRARPPGAHCYQWAWADSLGARPDWLPGGHSNGPARIRPQRPYLISHS